MARRRKKSRAAANAKLKKDDQSPMLVDKSLPALPPNAMSQNAFSPDRETPDSLDTDTPTELSPRPRQGYTQNDSSSRSSSRRPPERSPERTSSDTQTRDGLTLPTTTYRNNRHSTISPASDVNGDDGESFFIPLALDPSPAPNVTPRSTSETRVDPSKKSKENKAPEKDYFASKSNGRSEPQKSREPSSSSSTPHIAFQEKGRQPSAEETAQIKDSIRKAQAGGKASSTKASPAIGADDTRVQHANSPKSNGHGKTQSSADKFKLGEVPKGKKAGNSRSNSQSEISDSSVSRSTSGGLSAPPRKEVGVTITRTDSPKPLLSAENTGTPRSSQESRLRDDLEPRQSTESRDSSWPISRLDSGSTSRSIPRKELATGAVKNTISSSLGSSSGAETSPSSDSSSDTPGLTPTVNGKSISGPLNLQALVKDELAPPTRAPNRPSGPQQQLSDSYMAPRAPPQPPPVGSHAAKDSSGSSNGVPVSPKLPRWSAGGDFTMDEDMARILGGTDESSQSILRRVSNAVRHGRTNSEASNPARYPGHGRSVSETTTRTAASPRWPKTPIIEDSSAPRDISSPISITSPVSGDDPALLRRQLRNSEQRVAELERQFSSEKDLKSINKKLIEKRKTVSVLDSQAELMFQQLEVLTAHVQRAKDTKQPINMAELEDLAIKDFVQRIERLKQTMSTSVEALYEERNTLLEEKSAIMADRDRALVDFEQLSSKNAQLADMNNDLTHQIQERFKAQSGSSMDSPRPPIGGLGIYTHHSKDKSNVSVQLDDNLRPSTSTALFGSVNAYPQAMDQDPSMEPATVLSAPHVINIRKGQAKKFNWKKGGQTVAKGVSKGFKGAFSSAQQERNQQWAGQNGDSIGMPYNMTVAPIESPAATQSGNLPRPGTNDPRQGGGFGLFKKSNTMPKLSSNGAPSVAEHPSTLFGSDLVERADYERRQIPSVVTRCIEEVELRGMDIEGIYRKTGGNSQVKLIQEGFDKTEDYDISDPGLDITAVTSVLKQYFRRLPTPLLTFDVYDRVLESICKYHGRNDYHVHANHILAIENDQERCAHLRTTFNMLPPKHRDCLEFLIFHLVRVANRESENLVCSVLPLSPDPTLTHQR
jgi:Rho-type GTPase-activating protein 1/2